MENEATSDKAMRGGVGACLASRRLTLQSSTIRLQIAAPSLLTKFATAFFQRIGPRVVVVLEPLGMVTRRNI